MIYQACHWLFGWDYIAWKNSAASGIARVRVDNNGNVFYWRYKNTKVADPIRRAQDFLWLTCPAEKYLGVAVQGRALDRQEKDGG
jgi:hypothetical protein